MKKLSNDRVIKEIIVRGTLDQFRGFMEFEQSRTTTTDSPYRDLIEMWSLRLEGPLSNRPSSIYWLVRNGADLVLDMLAIGRGSGAGGAWGNVSFSPDMTLDEMEQEAKRQHVTLSRILGFGEIRVSELPQSRLRIVFALSGFESPGLFWSWTEDIIGELKRLGFGIESIDSMGVYPRLIELKETLTSRFDLEEIKELCFNLGVKYEELGSDRLSGKARELMIYIDNRTRVAELEEEMCKLRPDVRMLLFPDTESSQLTIKTERG